MQLPGDTHGQSIPGKRIRSSPPLLLPASPEDRHAPEGVLQVGGQAPGRLARVPAGNLTPAWWPGGSALEVTKSYACGAVWADRKGTGLNSSHRTTAY